MVTKNFFLKKQKKPQLSFLNRGLLKEGLMFIVSQLPKLSDYLDGYCNLRLFYHIAGIVYYPCLLLRTLRRGLIVA